MQVYLNAHDGSVLERLAAQLALTKSDVIRKALSTLEASMMDTSKHPALAVIGLVADDDGLTEGIDPALAHDRVLADAGEAPVTRKTAKRRARR